MAAPVISLSHAELTQALDRVRSAATCHAACHWRAAALRDTAGEATTERRARALNAVLARCPLPLVPGEGLIGVGALGLRVPAGTLADGDLEAAGQVVAELGERGFIQHRDHHAPDYSRLLARGFGGLQRDVGAALRRHRGPAECAFLRSMRTALDGAVAHVRRWRDRVAGGIAAYPEHACLLRDQADMLERLATEPAATFHEALQLTYLYHCMMQLDDRHAMALGRLDQYLLPFYEADCAAGRLTPEQAGVLLEHLFAKLTVTEDVQNITLGGVQPADGRDATNPLSFLILEACRAVGRAGGNCTARIHRDTPPAFLEACAAVIRTGIGYPALVNDEVMVPALLAAGLPTAHARDYCFVGCIETFIPGRSAPWADGRVNLLLCVERALRRGAPSRPGVARGPDTGVPGDFEAFYRAFQTQLHHEVAAAVAAANEAKRRCDDRGAEYTSPLLSATVQDCIGRGRDVNDGGAVYPGNHGLAGMGIAVTADALLAVKRAVFETPRYTLAELATLLETDFAGREDERQWLLRALPKYGNGEAEVDALAARVVKDFAAALAPHRTPRGGFYWGLLAANVQNVTSGFQVGATPDGRRSGTPLSDAASPTFGRDCQGPTAAIRSIASLPYGLCRGGNVVNLKIHPASLAGAKGAAALAGLVRTCFDLGGAQLQFNTTDRVLLQEAMAAPEEHRDLVVRVSGFSATFVDLAPAVQEDILERTEHALA